MTASAIDWESAMWHAPVAVAFGYPSDGWVLLAIMTAAFNQHVVVHCSDVFPPFDDLLRWLHRIADADLPAEFAIDEGGRFKHLVANRSSLGDHVVEFVVVERYWDTKGNEQSKPVLRCRTDRQQLVSEFVRRLRRWAR